MEKIGKKFNNMLKLDQDHKLGHMHKNSSINYKNLDKLMAIIIKIKDKSISILRQSLIFNEKSIMM